MLSFLMVSAQKRKPSGVQMVTLRSTAAAAAPQLPCASAASLRLSVSPSFLEGVQCSLDGAIIAAGLAHVLVGVYWICGCNSSGTGMVPHAMLASATQLLQVRSTPY